MIKKQKNKVCAPSKFDYNLHCLILNAIFLSLLTNLFNPFAVKFLYRLGGDSFHASLYNSIPGLISLFCVLPGLIILNKTMNKQKLMSSLFYLSRTFFLIIAFIPFLPRSIQPWMFLLAVAFRHIPESISSNALQGFIGDIFPVDYISTAISSKNRSSVVAQLSLSIVLFFILGILPQDNEKILVVYQCFFVLCFIFGMIEIHFFKKIKYTPKQSSENNSKKFDLSVVKSTFLNKNFRTFLIASLFFHFGWQMGWPLFSIYQVQYLEATEQWLVVFNIMSAIIMIFGYKFWNKAIQKKGLPLIMGITSLGMALTPALFALCHNLYIFALINLLTGLFTSGCVMSIQSSLLGSCPEENRMVFVGVHATLTNISLFISPFFGNFIHETYSIYLALFVCAGFRLIGSVAFFVRYKLNKNTEKDLSV